MQSSLLEGDEYEYFYFVTNTELPSEKLVFIKQMDDISLSICGSPAPDLAEIPTLIVITPWEQYWNRIAFEGKAWDQSDQFRQPHVFFSIMQNQRNNVIIRNR